MKALFVLTLFIINLFWTLKFYFRRYSESRTFGVLLDFKDDFL